MTRYKGRSDPKAIERDLRLLSTDTLQIVLWVAVSCPAWHGPAATRLVLPFLRTALVGNGSLLLKEIAPGVTRALVLRDPTTAAGIGQFAAIQAAAHFIGARIKSD